MFKFVLFSFATTLVLNAQAQVALCDPRTPSLCLLQQKDHGKRPSDSYTFTDEVPFKKCYADADNAAASCFKEQSLLRHPFILSDKASLDSLATGATPQQAPVAILMIHGLSDGPYYNKPMGTFLNKKFGVPVVALRLSGHGSVLPVQTIIKGKSYTVLQPQPADLGRMSEEQWYADVKYGYDIAKKLGKKVIVTGFSLGGVLAVNLYKDKKSENKIAGMLLFSPALALPIGVGQLTCTAADINAMQGQLFTSKEAFKGEGGLIRYMQMAYSGACNIQRITDQTQAINYASDIQVPTFALLSTADSAIDRDGLENFMSNIKVAKKLFVVNKTPGWFDFKEIFWRDVFTQTNSSFMEYHEVKEPLDHSWVMLDPNNAQDVSLSKQVNPLFAEASQSVCSFLKSSVPELAGGNCSK